MEFFNSLIHSLITLMVGVGTWIALTVGVFSADLVVKYLPPPPAIERTATSTPITQTKAEKTTATSTPLAEQAKKAAAPEKKKEAAPLPQTTAPTPAPAVITSEIIAQANTDTRASLVNILCIFRTAKTASYISGSGLMIDPRGVILTNAHVAQFFLLKDYLSPNNTSCTIRAGSPAVDKYKATLLYLPPTWVENNASQIVSAQAMGTGERDYAFLYITGPTQFAPAPPSSFTSLITSLESPKQDDPVLLAGYPAGFLNGDDIQRNLYISSAVSKIGTLYTFNSANRVDLISLGGTVVSQSGSSGGAVVNLATNKLVGLIATESSGTTTASRDLRAITMGHINESLQTDGKGSILSLLSGDLAAMSKEFNDAVAPALAKKLIAAIEAVQK